MSFYPQPNSYTCGPFALKYALVMLGIFKNERDIGKAAGVTWWAGTDEIGLARAAKKYNCNMKYFRESRGKFALEELNKRLKKGYPCILSVNNWGHWITILSFHKNRYIVVDSSQDKVIDILTPSHLLKKWKFVEEDVVSYDGYAIIPDFKVDTLADFSIERARAVMYKKNEQLAHKWDTYFNDLINVCRPRTPLASHITTFNEFLRRNEKVLIKEIAFWHGTPTKQELKKVLRNMQFVAEVYDLVIYDEDEKKAVIDLASILMMYSCGKYGMDPIY